MAVFASLTLTPTFRSTLNGSLLTFSWYCFKSSHTWSTSSIVYDSPNLRLISAGVSPKISDLTSMYLLTALFANLR